jgi:hypothetical protein
VEAVMSLDTAMFEITTKSIRQVQQHPAAVIVLDSNSNFFLVFLIGLVSLSSMQRCASLIEVSVTGTLIVLTTMSKGSGLAFLCLISLSVLR